MKKTGALSSENLFMEVCICSKNYIQHVKRFFNHESYKRAFVAIASDLKEETIAY
jgi:hypothetical protein